MSWRIAESLETLRKQLNAAFPKRSKVSDGGIGDANHASRSSDHNPWIKDPKGIGIVSARDFTHDPKTGIDCNWLADTLVDNKDPRIKYIIWNKKICSSKTSPWQWRPYKGVNAHKHHLHLSVSDAPSKYDSTATWKLDFPDDEGDDVATVSAVVPATSTTEGAVSTEGELQETSVPASGLPPIDSPTETTVTQEAGGTKVEVAAKNEQDVTETVTQSGPAPYNDIGFKQTIINDAKGVLPANVGLQTASDLAQQASSWPAWIGPLIGKLALIALVLSVLWVLYRVISWLVHTWRENERVKLQATINTDITRKNIEFEK
jgi:hypothetical protein